MWRWVDEGVNWLQEQFKGKLLEFRTSLNVEKREVTLAIYQHNPEAFKNERIFEVTEPIESFVSHLTVTKLILLAG